MKKVLVALDGSPSSLKALEKAQEWATKELHLLHVGPISLLDLAHTHAPMAGEDLFPKEIEQRLEANGRRILDEAAASIQRPDLVIKSHMFLGHPGDGICSLVDEEKYDCVFVGARGHGKLAKLFLGSVSDYVVHHCSVPVVVVRHG